MRKIIRAGVMILAILLTTAYGEAQDQPKFLRVLVRLYYGDPYKPQKFFAVLDPYQMNRDRETTKGNEHWKCTTGKLSGQHQYKVYINDDWSRMAYMNNWGMYKKKFVVFGGLRSAKNSSDFPTNFSVPLSYVDQWQLNITVQRPIYHAISVYVYTDQKRFEEDAKSRFSYSINEAKEMQCELSEIL